MPNIKEDYFISVESILFAHKCVFEKGDSCDYLSGRGFYGLTLAVTGSATCTLKSGETITLRAGEVAFIPKGSAYLSVAEDRYEHYTVNFMLTPDTIVGDEIKAMIEPNKMTVFSPTSPEAYERHFARLTEAWQGKAPGFRMRAMTELYTLLSAFVPEYGSLGVDEASFRLVRPAKEYLDTHYDKEISLSHLSALCSMSETSFRRHFLLVFGKTAVAYKNDLVLLHASDLLSDNLYSIGEIAEMCGFRDANYFSRFFKKHTGISPRDYRARYTMI